MNYSTIITGKDKEIEIIHSNPTCIFNNKNKRKNQMTNKTAANQTTYIFKCIVRNIITFEVPLFIIYFSVHQLLITICAGFYFLNNTIGVILLSICPALSIMALFVHFFLSNFNSKHVHVRNTFLSSANYAIALMVFCLGLLSIIAIFHMNTYLSNTLIISDQNSQNILYSILKFPYQFSANSANKLLNYRRAFSYVIIAPIVEESFKFFLLAMTFPFYFIWDFSNSKQKLERGTLAYNSVCTEEGSEIENENKSESSEIMFAAKSLFIIFIAICGACGIALMENIGYLAACEWKIEKYCFSKVKNSHLMSDGLSRGFFSVPFHCVTACIMGDVLAVWISFYFKFAAKIDSKCSQKLMWILWLIASYPISIFLPIFLHSSFNYWMNGLSQMIIIVTMVGFVIVALRIHFKYKKIRRQMKIEFEYEHKCKYLRNC